MKRILSGAAILVSCSLSAMAADVAVKAPPAAPAPAAAPAVDWTGFYIGGHGGAVDVNDNIVDVDGLNGGAHYQIRGSSGLGGGQAGYNYQWGYVVVGVEGDYSALQQLHEKRFDPNFINGTYSTLDGSHIWDVTGRIGLAYNGLFFYFKGGGAWTNFVASVDNSAGGFAGGRAYTGHYNGPIYGGGVEWFVFPNWSVKGEYQHLELGTQNAVLITPANGTFRYSNGLNGVNMWTVGLNYHFFSWPNVH